MLKENQIASLCGNEIVLNADAIQVMSDDEILRLVHGELHRYHIGQCAAFERESRARARELVLSGQLIPVDETGEKTSEEIYAELLAEENAKKVK